MKVFVLIGAVGMAWCTYSHRQYDLMDCHLASYSRLIVGFSVSCAVNVEVHCRPKWICS